MRAIDLARQRWEREEWGEPRDDEQARLWSLFWTGCEPDDEHPTWQAWVRPVEWVEELVRGEGSAAPR